MSTMRLLPRPSTFTRHGSSSTFTAAAVLYLLLLSEVNFAGERIDEGVAGSVTAMLGEVLTALTAFFSLDGAGYHAHARS
jgi:hypothetical protein